MEEDIEDIVPLKLLKRSRGSAFKDDEDEIGNIPITEKKKTPAKKKKDKGDKGDEKKKGKKKKEEEIESSHSDDDDNGEDSEEDVETIKKSKKKAISKKGKKDENPTINIKCNHTDKYHQFSSQEIEDIQKNLLKWYDINKRDLPWRKSDHVKAESDDELNQRGYAVWVSEIMLQQTRVQTVIDYYKRWMNKWPTVNALASATLEEVNEVWSGLGYYRRAKFLHEGAQEVVNKFEGKLPRTAKELEEIKGIGKYTSGAIASIAFSQKAPLVDGNVIRVLSRVRAIGADPKNPKAIKLHWDLAEKLVNKVDRPGSFNQGLMELGATVCTPTTPNCKDCPISSSCLALKEEGSDKKGKANKEFESTCTICGDWEDVNTPTDSVVKYPRKVKKTNQREETMAVCMIEMRGDSDNDSQFLLVQRPTTGLLANLWEFPQIEIEAGSEEGDKNHNHFTTEIKTKMDEFLKNDLGFTDYEIEKRKHIGNFIHIFSHIRQTLSVEHIIVKGNSSKIQKKKRNVKWMESKSIDDAAISKIVRKCLDLLNKKPSKQTKSPSKAKKKDTPTKLDQKSGKQTLMSAFVTKKQ